MRAVATLCKQESNVQADHTSPEKIVYSAFEGSPRAFWPETYPTITIALPIFFATL
jgi:hypothetical protein